MQEWLDTPSAPPVTELPRIRWHTVDHGNEGLAVLDTPTADPLGYTGAGIVSDASEKSPVLVPFLSMKEQE